MISDPTTRVTRYGQALAQAIRAFEVLEPQAGQLERYLIRLLRVTYQRRLRQMVAVPRGEAKRSAAGGGGGEVDCQGGG